MFGTGNVPYRPIVGIFFLMSIFIRDFFFFLATLHILWDLSSLPRDRTWASAVKAPSPNHWATRIHGNINSSTLMALGKKFCSKETGWTFFTYIDKAYFPPSLPSFFSSFKANLFLCCMNQQIRDPCSRPPAVSPYQSSIPGPGSLLLCYLTCVCLLIYASPSWRSPVRHIMKTEMWIRQEHTMEQHIVWGDKIRHVHNSEQIQGGKGEISFENCR